MNTDLVEGTHVVELTRNNRTFVEDSPAYGTPVFTDERHDVLLMLDQAQWQKLGEPTSLTVTITNPDAPDCGCPRIHEDEEHFQGCPL